MSSAKKGKKRKWVIFISVLMVLLAAELTIDIFEILMGKFLLLTNPIRPKVGRLWEEDLKEQQGIEELDAALQPVEELSPTQLQSVDDLVALLSIRQSINITRDEFKEFYKAIPVRQAKEMLDPLELLALDRSAEWQSTQLSLSGNQIVLYFLDGYEKPIKQNYYTLESNESAAESGGGSLLDQQEKFSDNIITAAEFYEAFDRLPRSFRLQIVNDPYKLVRWGAGLQRVGISRVLEDEGVEVVFEVTDDAGVKLYSMYASPIAVEYLVKELNEMVDSPHIHTPVRKDESHKDDH